MKVIRLVQVMEITGLARSTIYKLITEGGFPKSISLGARRVGWIDDEIYEWIMEKANCRNS